jgi:hypothetical protein
LKSEIKTFIRPDSYCSEIIYHILSRNIENAQNLELSGSMDNTSLSGISPFNTPVALIIVSNDAFDYPDCDIQPAFFVTLT